VNPFDPSPLPSYASRPEEANRVPLWKRWSHRIGDYFLGEDPSLLVALVPLVALSMALYTRSVTTNFIFDEQEALLANPYVRAGANPKSGIPWSQAFRRDFWGLLPAHTIGSYRPLPDLIWRAMWSIGLRDQSAFPHAYLNVLLHGLNGALLVLLVMGWTRNRKAAWLSGVFFVATAVLTEAVTGVVGLADVLGGTAAVLALLALQLPMAAMPIALFGATLLGLYSKESALCIVPLVPLGALLTSQLIDPQHPRRATRTALAAMAAAAAFVLYVELRRRCFPYAPASELSPEAMAHKPWAARVFAAALRWYAQPMLPHDPLNNPLIDAPFPLRVAGALRVFARGLGQVFVPLALSGDYSAPQEPIPTSLVFPESVIGAAAMVLPLAFAPIAAIVSWLRGGRERDLMPLAAFAAVWIAIAYFPVSNIPVLLPTVRAERFWYFPAIGTSILLALFFSKALSRRDAPVTRAAAAGLLVAFLGFQCVAAFCHARDYSNDLVFWDATRKAVPMSAKAHLNYSVMLGARGDLAGRLAANEVALGLAPQWPMANVYVGDTLCRLHRAPEALPHYLRGFALAPNDVNLIALGIQCLWDEHQFDDPSAARDELEELADKNQGTWLKYLVDDTVANGEENKGVDPKYRPRGYNEGPKKDE
jgi:hypothetical protein